MYCTTTKLIARFNNDLNYHIKTGALLQYFLFLQLFGLDLTDKLWHDWHVYTKVDKQYIVSLLLLFEWVVTVCRIISKLTISSRCTHK